MNDSLFTVGYLQDSELAVFPMETSNVGRYINCADPANPPNLYPQKCLLYPTDSTELKLALYFVATSTIRAGDELLYDYDIDGHSHHFDD